MQAYVRTLRPNVRDIAATLELDRAALAGLDDPDEIGAVYLGAFLDDLGGRMGAG